MQGHWKELRESLGPSRCPSRPWTPTCICLRCQNTELGWLVSVKWTWVSCSQITFNSSPGSMFDEAESNENPWDGSLLKLEMVNRSFITFIIPQEQLYTLCNAQRAVLGYQIKTKMFFSVSGQEKIANYDKHRVKPADWPNEHVCETLWWQQS